MSDDLKARLIAVAESKLAELRKVKKVWEGWSKAGFSFHQSDVIPLINELNDMERLVSEVKA